MPPTTEDPTTPAPGPSPADGRAGAGRYRRAGLIVLGGVLVWLAVLMAVGRSAESRCVDDLAATSAYGAYSQSANLWPPEFACTLTAADDEANPPLIIEHPGFALARLVATIVLPVLILGAAGATLMRSKR